MKQHSSASVDLGALSELAPELAETFVSLASDIALVIDPDGVIRKVAQSGSGPVAPGADQWVGLSWVDTVSGEARGKVEEMLREVESTGISHRREISHALPGGADVPVAYAAVRLGAEGPVLAVGRDLRAISAIQQQFVEAQQEIEREYWKHRQAESRYRVLFQVATDAVLVVDAESLRVIDANQAAERLFDIGIDRLVGMETVSTVDRASRPSVAEMLATARATGLSGEVRAWLVGRRISARVSATPFRSADSMLLLVRARAAEHDLEADDAHSRLIRLVERTPDAVVVVDAADRVIMANPAFVELARFADESHAKGRPLSDVVGEGLAELLGAARGHGIACGQPLVLRSLRGELRPIDVSAALLAEDDQESVGLTIRARAATDDAQRARIGDLAAAIETLTSRLGAVGLAELLTGVAEHAERYFIQVAMNKTDRDRSAAAHMLGVTASHLESRLRDDPGASGPGGRASSEHD